MADILFLYSFKTSIRLSGESGLSLFDLWLLNEIIITSCQIIMFFFYHKIWGIAQQILNSLLSVICIQIKA